MRPDLKEVLDYVSGCKQTVLERSQRGADTSPAVLFGMICGIETKLETALDTSATKALDSTIVGVGETPSSSNQPTEGEQHGGSRHPASGSV